MLWLLLCNIPSKTHFLANCIHHRQIFSGGVSDQNENLVGKFFARLRRAKKGVPKFFACGGLFSLWRHWKPLKKPLKTAKNRKIFLKTSIFWKKWPQNFFVCGGLFFRKIGRTILQIWSDKRGGVKNILYPPLDNVCPSPDRGFVEKYDLRRRSF